MDKKETIDMPSNRDKRGKLLYIVAYCWEI